MSDSGFNQNYRYVIEGIVEWTEMDAFQHVNNTAYFRYFERVRIALLEECGFGEHVMNEKVAPILASTQCKFKAPLKYPDSILIGTTIDDIQEDRFLMLYAVYSKSLDKIAAEGDGVIVYYDYDKEQKTAIPDTVRKNLEKFTKK